MTHALACAAYDTVQFPSPFSFQHGLDVSLSKFLLSVLQFHVSLPSCPTSFPGKPERCLFDVFWARVFHINQSAILQPQNLPTCERYTENFIKKKTAPARPLTFFHEVDSHTSLFRASLVSSHCSRPEARGCTRHVVLDHQVVDIQEQ